MQFSACPGKTKTGAVTSPCSVRISTASWVSSPSRAAVCGAISAALSQLSRVNGRGSSSSHALSAKRPSPIISSGRNSSLRPSATGSGGWPDGGRDIARRRNRQSRRFGVRHDSGAQRLVPERRELAAPRCSLQPRQCSRTSSCGFGPVLPCRMASTSCTDWPP